MTHDKASLSGRYHCDFGRRAILRHRRILDIESAGRDQRR